MNKTLNFKTFKTFLQLILLVVSVFGFSQTPVTFTANPTNAQINTALIGNNINITGDVLNFGDRATQIATFTNGTAAALQMNNGVFFGTGTVAKLLTTNNATESSDDIPTTATFTDADLTAIDATATRDVVSYSFTVTLGPKASTLNIKYQFGSEEYPNFVGSAYDDAMGFFVTGPGITGTANLARLPNNNPISINKVNFGVPGVYSTGVGAYDGSQSALYINNGHNTTVSEGKLVQNTNPGPFPVAVQFNGITRLITYSLSGLTPGGTYTFKIVIADAGDANLDSGVFINTIYGTATLIANNDTYTIVSGSTSTTSVLNNDSVNGAAPASLSDVLLSQVSTTNTGVNLDPLTGKINVAAGTPAGTYTVTYQICDQTFTSNCKTATATITVQINDSDNDGIDNYYDLDDDNDGILDTTEGQCINTSNPSTDGFDSPLVATVNGNNIQSVNPYNGWGTETGGANAFNVIRVNGAGYSSGPDVAQSGTQYIDINASSAYVYKDIILTTPTVFSASAWFANRETSIGGYAPWSSNIQIRNQTTSVVVAQGNTVNLTAALGDEYWYKSAITSVSLPAGTYRIRMFVSDFGHLDSISYCFSTDTDGDGTPNYLDLDSDGDGCFDAIEGGDNVTAGMLDGIGRINVAANGTTTPVVVDANGVPVVTNTSSTYNVDGQAQGQTIGQSQINNPAAVAGTVGSNQTIVSGSAPSALSLTGSTGTIQWQSSTDNVTFTNISGATSATYAPGALTATTYYRAVLTSAGGCTANSTTVTINIDSDGDGVPDYQDLDSDNDGILDIFECPQSVVDVNFSVANGNSQTFSAPAADLGFIFDVYTLDNSFTLTVNGASISSSKLEFQPDQTDNVRFVDGNTYGNGTVPQIYTMTGTAANPLVRIIIHKNGAISMYGSKTSGGPLFPLQLYNGNNFNTIIWNQTSANTVVVSQVVVGATHISGRGNGVRNGFCDPDNDGISNQFDVDSDNDGCADAIEGSENVKYNQIHDFNLPLADPNYAYRGQIKVTYNGTTTSTPSGIISNSPSANGVPQLLNNAGNNLNASTNPSNLAGAVDNTDGTADIGQGIGDSQNIMVNSCAVPFICDTNMYVVQGNPSVLYRIDTSTNPFNFVQIGTGATYPVNATGYNPTDNFIYGIKGGANVDKSLIRIDANGIFYNLGVISGLDIAMSYTSGEMDELGNYYIKLAGPNNNKLYKVDVATRTATLIQLSRNVSFIDIAYTQTDGLLWAQDTVSKKLVSINPTNGLVTDLPFVNTLNNYGAWFGSGTGQIYASSNDGTAFVEFNKTTGEAMFISTTQPSTNNDGAHCPTAPIKFDLYCNKLPVTNAGTQLPSNHGITALGRAGADNSNWPMVRQSAWTVLEAKTKGFVVNRVANPATDIANPVEGMMVFDTTAQCLKIYNGTVWSCYSTPACP